MEATNITTQKKKRWRVGQKQRRAKGLCYDCLFDCTSGITDCVYLSSVCGDGKLQLL